MATVSLPGRHNRERKTNENPSLRGQIPHAPRRRAGHGLNLQAGGHLIVWYTLTWSLELYQQLNARLHRQGQTHPVTITHLVTDDTIDESVLAALENKNTTQAALINAVKTQLRKENS